MFDTRYRHIVPNERGAPIIAGTRMKVRELVTAQKAYGWSAEELYFQFPHLTLGQIYSALAYYWDNKEAIDAEIAEGVRFAAEMRAKGESPLQTVLRERVRQQ